MRGGLVLLFPPSIPTGAASPWGPSSSPQAPICPPCSLLPLRVGNGFSVTPKVPACLTVLVVFPSSSLMLFKTPVGYTFCFPRDLDSCRRVAPFSRVHRDAIWPRHGEAENEGVRSEWRAGPPAPLQGPHPQARKPSPSCLARVQTSFAELFYFFSSL